MPAHQQEEADQHRHRDRDHPGAGQELRRDDDDHDESGGHGAEAVQQRAPPPAGAVRPQPVAHHPGLRERERREDADHVQVDQRVDVRAEGEDQAGRGSGEHEDPVRVREPVAEIDELPRHEAVLGEERCEPREALVRRVRREHQNRERERLHQVEHDRRMGAGGEGASGDLRKDRDGMARAGVHLHREIRDAEEESHGDRGHQKQRPRRVLRLRPLEGGDAVGDRLDAGQRCRSRGEGLQ